MQRYFGGGCEFACLGGGGGVSRWARGEAATNATPSPIKSPAPSPGVSPLFAKAMERMLLLGATPLRETANKPRATRYLDGVTPHAVADGDRRGRG